MSQRVLVVDSNRGTADTVAALRGARDHVVRVAYMPGQAFAAIDDFHARERSAVA